MESKNKTKSGLLLLLLLQCGEISAQGDDTLPVHLISTTTFGISYHRAIATGTGAAVGGLIGAGIGAKVSSNKDRDKRELLEPFIENSECEVTLLDSLTTKLASRGISAKIEKNPPSISGSRGISLDIKECGFKLTDSQAMLISPYVKFDLVIRTGKSGESLFQDNLYLIGKKSYSFEEMLARKEGIDQDLQDVLKKAGSRVASKFIYKARSTP